MPRRSAPHSATSRLLTGAGILLLTVIVIALAVAALSRTSASESVGTAQPVPTFTVASTPTPTPTPTPTATAVAAPGAAERFLAMGSGVWWRATAGACGGAAPTLERSDDSGATWTDVTPAYLGVAQILALDTFAGDQAQIVALVGSSCETQALRTFTAGEFWESSPDVLAASTYLSPTDPTSVVTPAGTVAAPCTTPWGVRAESGTTGVICDGVAYQLTASNTWTALATDAAALTVGDGAVTVATTAEVAVPAAVALDGTTLLAWSGESVQALP
ncbi:MAG: hypothetical protein QM604_00450 [Microbacterium sp.]